MGYHTKPKELPSQEYLKECFDYDPKTGALTWKVRPIEHFLDSRIFKIWNTRYSGKEVTHSDKNGYKKVSLKHIDHLAHRVIYKLIHGVDPDSVDHINGITSDNRVENLRDVSHQENHKNMKRRSDNASGIAGVCWADREQRWTVQIYTEKKKKYLGCFTDFFEACCTRKSAERKYGYHENHGRN